MRFRTLPRLLLVIPLLISALSLTPAQAQTDSTKLVVWCPAAVIPPTPNKNGCTAAFPQLANLWAALGAMNPAKAKPGTIWLGKNYNTASAGDSDQFFDGSALTTMANFPLTIQGGWKGPGTSTLDVNHPSIFAGHSLTIANWNGRVTLRNLRVQAAAATFCSDSAAVCVYTKGSIKLDRIQVVGIAGSGFYGAYLENTDSVSSPPGSVAVTNSVFLRNDSDGLAVYTDGAVTLKNVVSGQNNGDGVNIDNHSDATASPVTITTGLFDQNQGSGLVVESNGTVTLTGVEAQDNDGVGTYVSNGYGIGDVLLKGTNTFLGNHASVALYVVTNGKVSADRLVANGNAGVGVFLQVAKGVTIGSGEFKGNGGSGLGISAGGPITASSLTAIANDSDGLVLSSLAPADTQAVTLSGVKVNLNTGSGIAVAANGKATLSCGTAYGNAAAGLLIRAVGGSGPAGGLKLRGFRSYLNGTDEDLDPTQGVTRTACP